VSDRAGTIRLRTFDVVYGKNSVVVAREGSPCAGDVRELPCRPLGELATEAQVIKVDVEGHEYTFLPSTVGELDRARL
jgi:hypothetical protein